jgi:hypothetical protein
LLAFLAAYFPAKIDRKIVTKVCDSIVMEDGNKKLTNILRHLVSYFTTIIVKRLYNKYSLENLTNTC